MVVSLVSGGLWGEVWAEEEEVEEWEFRGVVVAIEEDETRFIIEADGEMDLEELRMVVDVSWGDAQVNYLGRRIKGRLLKEGEAWRLEEIWPYDKEEATIIGRKNIVLKDDLLNRKGNEVRKIGEELPPFALYSQDAELVSEESLKGKIVVMGFMFTRDPEADRGPAQVLKMRRLQQELERKEIEGVRFVVLTFDPVNDGPGVLKQYGGKHGIKDAGFMFLTGDEEMVNNLRQEFGIYIMEKGKGIEHTMKTLIINEEGRIAYGESGIGWKINNFLTYIQKLGKKEDES